MGFEAEPDLEVETVAIEAAVVIGSRDAAGVAVGRDTEADVSAEVAARVGAVAVALDVRAPVEVAAAAVVAPNKVTSAVTGVAAAEVGVEVRVADVGQIVADVRPRHAVALVPARPRAVINYIDPHFSNDYFFLRQIPRHVILSKSFSRRLYC